MQTPPPADDRTFSATALDFFVMLRKGFLQVTEAGAALVAFIVLIHILLGAAAGPYVASVIANLTGLIAAIGAEALVGVALVLALLHLAGRRR